MPAKHEDDFYFDRIGAKASGTPRRGENLCLGCYERAAEITLLKEQIAALEARTQNRPAGSERSEPDDWRWREG